MSKKIKKETVDYFQLFLNSKENIQKYSGKYIALDLDDGSLVSSDDSFGGLFEKVKEKNAIEKVEISFIPECFNN